LDLYCKWTRLDIKSQDYRAIAEGARIRLFWHLAGVRESVADNYLGKQRTDLDWVRNGLRGWELETHMASHHGPLPPRESLEIVRQLWLSGQIRYFQSAAKSNEKKLDRMEMWKRGCFASFLLIAVAVLVAKFGFCWPPTGVEEPVYLAWLIIAMDSFLVAGALLHHATSQRAYPQHMKQFRRMETVFQKALELIGRKLEANDLAGVRQCLLKLGQEALSENGDWVLLHRERPLELPPP
jgi:hypothetical protein